MIRIAIIVSAVLTLLIAHFVPFVGYGAQLHRLSHARDSWRVAADNWKTASVGWERSFRKAERLRVEEQTQAVAAVDGVQLQCDARVKQARASAKKIKELVYAPPKTDAAGCVVRGLLDPGRVRDAIGAQVAR